MHAMGSTLDGDSQQAVQLLHAPDEYGFSLEAVVTRLVRDDFKGQLGAFTPCFTDVVILGE